jgi:thrombospondin 2/3/4/5
VDLGGTDVDDDLDGTTNALESFLCDTNCDGYSDQNDHMNWTPMTSIAQPNGCQPLWEDGPPPDDDSDSVPNAQENCYRVVNEDQTDTDEDGIGDACDDDTGS